MTDSSFLKEELFLQRLPHNVKIVLASTPDTTSLEMLAEMAALSGIWCLRTLQVVYTVRGDLASVYWAVESAIVAMAYDTPMDCTLEGLSWSYPKTVPRTSFGCQIWSPQTISGKM